MKKQEKKIKMPINAQDLTEEELNSISSSSISYSKATIARQSLKVPNVKIDERIL